MDDDLRDWQRRQRWKWHARIILIASPLIFGLLAFGYNAAVTGKWPKASWFTTHDKD